MYQSLSNLIYGDFFYCFSLCLLDSQPCAWTEEREILFLQLSPYTGVAKRHISIFGTKPHEMVKKSMFDMLLFLAEISRFSLNCCLLHLLFPFFSCVEIQWCGWPLMSHTGKPVLHFAPILQWNSVKRFKLLVHFRSEWCSIQPSSPWFHSHHFSQKAIVSCVSKTIVYCMNFFFCLVATCFFISCFSTWLPKTSSCKYWRNSCSCYSCINLRSTPTQHLREIHL